MDKRESMQTSKPQLVRSNLNLYEVQLSVFLFWKRIQDNDNKVTFLGVLFIACIKIIHLIISYILVE